MYFRSPAASLAIATTSSAAQPSPPQALFVSVRVPWLGSVTILIAVIESPASTSLYPQSPAAVQPAYATSSDAVAVSPAFEGASFVFVTVIVKSSLAAAPLPSVQVVLTATVPTSPLAGVPLYVRVLAVNVIQPGNALPF